MPNLLNVCVILFIDSRNCIDLTFDKTTNLNGYKVRAIGTEIIPYLNLLSSNNNFNDLIGFDGYAMRTIFSYFNVSIVMKFNHDGILGRAGTDGFGLLHELSQGNYDIILNSVYMYELPNMTITPTHSSSGVTIIAHFMPPKTTLTKIIDYLGYRLILATFAITILTLLILYCFNKNQSMGMAVLESVRLLSNGSIRRIPTALPPRIMMSTIFLFFLIFQALFQGKLADLLTRHVPERILRTQEDLINYPEYKIFVPKPFTPWLDERLISKIIGIPEITCINRILNDTHTVCISDLRLLKYYAGKYNLYIAKVPIRSTHLVYRMRKDWPLRRKFFTTVVRIKQSGLYGFWEQKASNFSKRKMTINESDDENREFATVKLNDIAFAFKSLLLGSSIGILIFFIEIKLWVIIKTRVKKIVSLM